MGRSALPLGLSKNASERYDPLQRLEALPTIFAHEEAHVRHRHSYDIVVVEVLTALQWFNPVVWFLRQELRTLHEYEADASVLSRGFDESQYIHLLMQKATGIQACVLANGINTHKTKKRIIMMLKPKSKRSAWFKALYIVPVALASLAMTAKTVTDYETTPAAEPVVRMFTDTGHGRGDCYQIRHQPGVKFFHNGREETIPNGRSIALEVSKTTMLLNGNPIDQITLLDLPAQLKEIHLTEVNPDQFELNMVTEIPSRKTVLIVNDEVVSEDVVNSIVKEDVVNVDVISNKEFCRKYDAEAENVVLIRTKQSDDDPVFEVCEQLPSFPGGEAKLMEFLMRNMRYPQIAKDNGVQGRVLAQFIVEKDGTLSNVKILDSPQGSGVAMVTVVATMSEEERQKAENHNVGVQALRDEAVRVINAMPKWTPGKQRGQTVRAKFTIPVTFRLN